MRSKLAFSPDKEGLSNQKEVKKSIRNRSALLIDDMQFKVLFKFHG